MKNFYSELKKFYSELNGKAIFDDMEAVLKSSILSRPGGRPAGWPGGWILLRIRLSKAKLLGFVLPLAFAWQQAIPNRVSVFLNSIRVCGIRTMQEQFFPRKFCEQIVRSDKTK